MSNPTQHDTWSAGDNYESYMGRWSGLIATEFIEWLDLPPALKWLEVGCGSGALSAAIVKHGRPASVVAVDRSPNFVAAARTRVNSPIASFLVGDAQNLDLPSAAQDAVVSGLMVNFLPDPIVGLREMVRVTRAQGTVAFYVWDYPGQGVQFMEAFWQAAIACNPAAAEFDESTRFAFCTAEKLSEMATEAGLNDVANRAIEKPSVFPSFDDLWRPFTLGTGPAPGYCAALDPQARETLRETLRDRLPIQPDGTIPLTLRAWGVKGII